MRSVALDLDRLTFNFDSGQTHYLGTSSVRLFTKLIGARSPDAAAIPDGARSSGGSSIHGSSKHEAYAHSKHLDESCRQLYNTLRKCLPSEDDARTLLDVYFRNFQVDHPFLHSDSLLSAIEALYQCAATEQSGDLFVHHFTLNGDCICLRRTHRLQPHQRLHYRGRYKLPTTLQSRLLQDRLRGSTRRISRNRVCCL